MLSKWKPLSTGYQLKSEDIELFACLQKVLSGKLSQNKSRHSSYPALTKPQSGATVVYLESSAYLSLFCIKKSWSEHENFFLSILFALWLYKILKIIIFETTTPSRLELSRFLEPGFICSKGWSWVLCPITLSRWQTIPWFQIKKRTQALGSSQGFIFF